jgi:cohesin loading factor subunit SCC2
MCRIVDGKSIHTITALLLQLVQASAFGAIKRLRSSVAEAEILGVTQQKLDVAEEVCAA